MVANTGGVDMTADLSLEPWSRLVRLAPPAVGGERLQEAADRYESNGDLFAAAADLWEEEALAIDVAPAVDSGGPVSPEVASVSQDGVSVTYVAPTASEDTQANRAAQANSYRSRAAMFRKRSKPAEILSNPDVPDWFDAKDSRNRRGWPGELDEDNGIIEVVW